ncbi:MAG TPA: DUF2934 domain-containing protein [Candidatus Dormibacteraeota bacterium]|nr:DUF2934 domain-containing protein [Candidatus Dormibacteraeota bacterium]
MADLHQDVPTKGQIQLRAYELYVQRGGGDGRDLEDWLAAERELRNQHSSGSGKSDRQGSSSTDRQEKPKAFAAVTNTKGR